MSTRLEAILVAPCYRRGVAEAAAAYFAKLSQVYSLAGLALNALRNGRDVGTIDSDTSHCTSDERRANTVFPTVHCASLNVSTLTIRHV